MIYLLLGMRWKIGRISMETFSLREISLHCEFLIEKNRCGFNWFEIFMIFSLADYKLAVNKSELN
jgi:hypothetical protein